MSSVEYQGHRIELAKHYRDEREYKDDPHNLTAAQAQRVEILMRAAPFGLAFTGFDDLWAALNRLEFPGYGLFYANQLGAHLDPKLEIAYVEIPTRSLNRYLTLEKQPDGSLRVIDDFVAAAWPEIARVGRNARGALEYRYQNGNPVVPMRL